VVLFNGGVFESPQLRNRLLEVLESWFDGSRSHFDDSEENSRGLTAPGASAAKQWNTPWRPIVLGNNRLDLAVARGAAYYGMVRRGQGVRIAAGLARTYYIGVESASSAAEPQSPGPQFGGVVPLPSPLSSLPSAICLLPAGIEPGHDVELADRRFDLLVSEPAEFPLFVSSTRLTDKPGELAPIDRERMTPLPPMRTVLRTRKKGLSETVAVTLHARLTEIGTLDLWCSEIGGRRSWRLQFDVRSATQTDVAAHLSQAEGEGMIDEALWRECHSLIESTFGSVEEKKGTGPICRNGPPGASHKLDLSPFSPEGLVKRLAAAAGMSRNQWPTSLCRRMWEALMEFESGRRRSAVHETRWLNLLGFALRPGYGLAIDDWRVAQTWTTLQGKFAHAAANVRVEGWILWRRIAGGLAAGQQQALAEPLLGLVRGLHRQLTTGKGRGEFGFAMHETAEMWRLLGSLELLSAATKTELGTMLLDILPKRKMEPVRPAMIWALGRLGARVPMYGPLNAVVPAETAASWLVNLTSGGKGDRSNLCEAPGGPFRQIGPVPFSAQLAVMQLARRTDDRYRDLTEKLRREAADWLTLENAPPHFVELVHTGGSLDSDEQGLVFGESLPKGLRMT